VSKCVSIILNREIINVEAPKYGAKKDLIILYASEEILLTAEKNSKWVKFPKVSNTKIRRDKVVESGIAPGGAITACFSMNRVQVKRDCGDTSGCENSWRKATF
jgi:hypothetical protein